jgi:hypothetical protein
MMRDWDNLIILDACRYDTFAKRDQISGNLSKVVSRASHSWEFMKQNFLGRDCHDTVYVTANPHAERLPDDIFYTVENILDKWDSEYETVHPDDVVAAAVEAHNRYPNKRLIVHFMQPHEPWIGPTMDQLLERVDLHGYDKDHAHEGEDQNISGKKVWTAVRSGKITRQEMNQAYQESLDIVLRYSNELIEELGGKSVITADHAELLGERLLPLTPRIYGHPHSIDSPSLCEVPWLEIPSEERRKVISEEPIGFERMDDKMVNDRLAALGYA